MDFKGHAAPPASIAHQGTADRCPSSHSPHASAPSHCYRHTHRKARTSRRESGQAAAEHGGRAEPAACRARQQRPRPGRRGGTQRTASRTDKAGPEAHRGSQQPTTITQAPRRTGTWHAPPQLGKAPTPRQATGQGRYGIAYEEPAVNWKTQCTRRLAAIQAHTFVSIFRYYNSVLEAWHFLLQTHYKI